MGQAREVLDRMTAAVVDQHSVDSAASYYTNDAVLITPDAGEIHGRSWKNPLQSGAGVETTSGRSHASSTTGLVDQFLCTTSGSTPH
jgi:hypothetical protein